MGCWWVRLGANADNGSLVGAELARQRLLLQLRVSISGLGVDCSASLVQGFKVVSFAVRE